MSVCSFLSFTEQHKTIDNNKGGNMAQRGGGPSRNNSYNFGTSDQRAAEANRYALFAAFLSLIILMINICSTLVEQENDNKWGDLEEQTAMLKSVIRILFLPFDKFNVVI